MGKKMGIDLGRTPIHNYMGVFAFLIVESMNKLITSEEETFCFETQIPPNLVKGAEDIFANIEIDEGRIIRIEFINPPSK
jgi:hypothetical protein